MISRIRNLILILKRFNPGRLTYRPVSIRTAFCLVLYFTALCGVSAAGINEFVINSGTVTLNNSEILDVEGSISISTGGILKCGVSQSAEITLTRNWTSSGTFISGDLTVEFYGTDSSTITGNTSFYNLKCSTGGKEIYFEAGSTQTVTGTLTLSGSSGELIKLRSTIEGTAWFIKFPNGAQKAYYVDVQDSDALSNNITASNSINNGNNDSVDTDHNWIFEDDTTAPAGITTLSALTGAGRKKIDLSWYAPGDDEWDYPLYEGSEYYIQYATYSINWSTSNPNEVIDASGDNPYDEQELNLTMDEAGTYYFRIWTHDAVMNWSGISNGATCYALPNQMPQVTVPTQPLAANGATVYFTVKVTDEDDATVDLSFKYYWGGGYSTGTFDGGGTGISTGTLINCTWYVWSDLINESTAQIKIFASDVMYDTGTATTQNFNFDSRCPQDVEPEFPVPDAQYVSINTALSCTLGTDATNFYYQFIIDDTSDFSNNPSSSSWDTSSTWSPSGLGYSTEYWWKVKAKDVWGNTSGWSSLVSSFTTTGSSPATLLPAGITDDTGWTGTVTSAAISDDSDATYALATAAGVFKSSFTNSSAYVGAVISSITIHVRAGGGPGSELLDWGPTGYLSGSPVTLTADTWLEYSKSWINNPAGGSWTAEAIDNLIVDINVAQSGGWKDTWISKVWVVVYFTPNSPPVPPDDIALDPLTPSTTEHITCKVKGSYDNEGDSVTYKYRWYKDNEFIVEMSSYTAKYNPGSTWYEVTLSSVNTSEGEEWYCIAWAKDYHGFVSTSSIKSSTVTIQEIVVGANRYWVGATANWNDADNWSDTSGGGGGAGVPGPDDTAIFDGGDTTSCQIDISSTVASVIIYSTYTATISINSGKSLTTSGSFEIAGGTFTTNGEILDVGSYTQTGGIFNAGGSTITCNSDFSVTVGTFNADASVLVLDATDGNATFTGDGYTFNNVIFQSTGTVARTWTLGAGAITFNGDFQLKAQGTVDLTVTAITNNPDLTILGSVDYTGTGTGIESISMGDGTWTVGGNVDFSGGTVDASTSTFVLNGSSTQTLTMDGNNLNILQITNSSSDGVYFADNLSLSTFTATTGDTNLYFCGGSTFTFTNIELDGQLASSRIVLKSTSTGIAWYLTVTGDQSVSCVDVRDSDASGGNTIDADDGTNKDSGNNVNWDFEAPGDRYWVASSAGDWQDPDNWSTSSGGAPPATVPFSSNKAIFDGDGLGNCNIDINASVTDVVIYSTYTATVSINTSQSLTTSSSFSIAGGTFTTNGEILDVGSYTQTGGIFNAGGSTVTCNGDFSVTVGTFDADASVLVLDATGGNAAFTGDGYTFNNVIFQSTGTAVRTWTLGAGTITINGDFQLKAQGSWDLTVTAVTNNPDLDILGSVDYIGTGAGTESLSMGEGTWTVGGDVDFSGGTVDESTSTFVLNGTSTQTLTMDGNSLNILQITNSSSGVYFADNLTLSTFTATTGSTRLYFCGGSTFTFTNINFDDQAESSRIVLKSTSTGTAWYLTVTGNQSVSYVDVEDSDASGGDTILAIDGTSQNSGNNINWDFGPPAAITDLTGLCDSDTGDVTLSWSTPGDDDWTGTLPSGSKYRIDYSTYSIQWSTTTYDVEISTSGVAPHTQVSYTITGLTGGTTWYFQIWTRDDIPTNWSGLSNGATVWVNPILSVTIEPSTRAFGEVPANQSDVLTDGFTVENAGNITQKYQLRLTGVPTGWAAKNVAGEPEWEQVKILGLFTTQSPLETTHFNDNPPDTGAGDIVRTTTDDQATSTNFAVSEEGAEVKGYDVTVGGIRYLWFRFDAPSGTSITTQQFLTVTVTAIQQ